MFSTSRRFRFFVVLIVIILFVLYSITSTAGLQTTPAGLSDDSSTQLHMVVSLATTKKRLNYELQVTLRSLLQQRPHKPFIHVYVPKDELTLFKDHVITHPGSPLAHPRVRIIPSNDYGPGTKFIPAILDSKPDEPTALIVCDDDHHYGPRTIASLYSALQRDPSSAYGTRGWRVRADLKWGVKAEEQPWHIIYGIKIARPYQVGVVTANKCYALNTAWFHDGASTTSTASSGDKPMSAAMRDIADHSVAPPGARFMDDVWINGHLARLGVKRYVIPSSSIDIDISRVKTLENQLGIDPHDGRVRANEETIRFFEKEFVSEGIPYVFHDDDADGARGPAWRSPLWNRVVVPMRQFGASTWQKLVALSY